MSSDTSFVTPEMVEEERNLLRQMQNALGIETADSDADDTLLAAIVANSARTGEMLSVLTGQPIDVQASLDLEGVDITQEEISDALQNAQMAVERITLYQTSVSNNSDNLLSQPLRPMTDHSSFRVDVSLDTSTTVSLRTEPDDQNVTAFDELLNRGNPLTQNAKREFQFDVDPDAEYNFRAGAAATFNTFRLVEVMVL